MHNRRRPPSGLPALWLALLATLPAAQEADSLRALETFDAVWSTIESEHFDPDFNGVDWQAVRTELRPRVEHLKDRAELRSTIDDMLARLGQSHFQLIPAEFLGTGAAGSNASPAGTAGLDLRWIGGAAVVVDLVAGGPAEMAGVRTGMQLTAVNGSEVSAILARPHKHSGLRAECTAPRLLMGEVDGVIGSPVDLELEDEHGERAAFHLVRVARDGTPFDMPGLPTFFLSWSSERVQLRGLEVGVLRFSNWFQPLLAPLDSALMGMRDCDAIVIDLRGNTGGDGTIATTLAGHFFDERTSLGSMRMRHGTQSFGVRPRTTIRGRRTGAFHGQLALLVDETTGSSSEVFTGGMQSLGRARVFGARTAGAALPARLTALPNGDSLMHAIGEFTTATGQLLEGGGVQPDEPVERTRADCLAGRDPAREAALRWIAREHRR